MRHITLSSSVNPSVSGQRVALIASLNFANQSAPTGVITFNVDNGMWSIPADITGLTARLDTSYLTYGSHTIVATYSGDSNWLPSSSAPLTQYLPQAVPTLTLSSSVSPSVSGQTVVITANISVPGAGGYITFNVDNVTWSILPFSAGQALLYTTALPAGTHTIVASYPGNSDWAPVTSAPLTQVVNKGTPPLILTSSANPSADGQLVKFTASLGIVSGIEATGTVTFNVDNGVWVIPAPVNGDTARLDTSELSPGPHTIVAIYSGDSNWTAVTTAPLSQTVNAAPSN